MKRDARILSKERRQEARRRAMILTRKQWHDRDVAVAQLLETRYGLKLPVRTMGVAASK